MIFCSKFYHVIIYACTTCILSFEIITHFALNALTFIMQSVLNESQNNFNLGRYFERKDNFINYYFIFFHFYQCLPTISQVKFKYYFPIISKTLCDFPTAFMIFMYHLTSSYNWQLCPMSHLNKKC